MNNTKAHQQLCSDIRFELQKAYPDDLRIFQRNVGLAIPFQSYKASPNNPHPIMYGVIGEADLQGWLRVHLTKYRYVAAAFAFEVKTGTGRLQKDQIKWKQMFLSMGGIYLETHSVEESLMDIKNEIAGFLYA